MAVFALLFSFFLFLLVILKFKRNQKNLPPGPKKLPIIGNLHNLFGNLPHRSLQALAKKWGPLMHLQLGEISMVVVTSPEAAKEVVKTHDVIFASRPRAYVGEVVLYDHSDIALAPYGNYWRQLRRICSVELFTAKRVQSFRSIREEEYMDHARYMARNSGSTINFTDRVDTATNGIMMRTTLGKKTEQTLEFISIAQEIQPLGSGFSLADLYPSIPLLKVVTGLKRKVVNLHNKADRILQIIIDEHRDGEGNKQKKHEDFIDVLLKLQDPQLDFNLTTSNIKAILLDMFNAGSETSSTTVNWAMSEMLRNPSVLKKAQDEVRQVFKEKRYVDESDFHQLEYLKLVIKETLRMHAPAPLLLPRENSVEIEVCGYKLPAKTQVLINAWAIARDSKYWDEAETFKPERFLDDSTDYYKGNSLDFFAFGAGRRICPGMNFGLANVELPLALFLYHFDWELPNGMKPEDVDMSESYGVGVRRKNDLHVTPLLRIPLPSA